MWGLLCCLYSCSCWSPDQIDAPKTGQIARKHGSRTDKLTNRGAAGAGALCWGGRADDPNKLKATKINYENFHFTFEFLVTCNFVKLMRLFGVPNLIMKMSLCKFLCLFLFLCALLCLFRHCYTVSQSQWNEFQLSKVIIIIFWYEYSDIHIHSWILLLHSSLRYLSTFCSLLVLIRRASLTNQRTHTQRTHTHQIWRMCATLRYMTTDWVRAAACSCHVKRKQFAAKLLHGSACRFPVIRFCFTFASATLPLCLSPSLSMCLSPSRYPYSNPTRRALCALSGTCRHV